jgi:hypothetical protein
MSAALLAGCPPAFGAGGHHAVDDAALLPEGQCELESWFTREQGGPRLWHAGTGCRVGPVELGVATEHAHPGGPSETAWGVQLKWATEIAEGISLGASLAPAWQAHLRPRHQGSTLAALVSWAPTDAVALHLNLGRDLLHRAPDQARAGAAFEWTPSPGWTWMLERHVEERTHWLRTGLRWAVSEQWSVDASRANRLRGSGHTWTFGATWQFARR